MEISVVLTSAAVAAVVSGLFTFVSQLLERRARRQELLMKTAVDVAVKHWEHARELSKQGMRVEIPALGWLAYDYCRQFGSVMKDGRLPPEVQQAYDAWLRQAGQGGGANVPHPPGAPASGSSQTKL